MNIFWILDLDLQNNRCGSATLMMTVYPLIVTVGVNAFRIRATPPRAARPKAALREESSGIAIYLLGGGWFCFIEMYQYLKT